MCVPEVQGASYLESAPWVECTTSSSDSQYLYKLLLPSIIFTILYIIGYPFLIFMLLFLHRKELHSKKTEIMFGFLYENFKHKFWWFEILLMGRRIMITLALTVIPDTLPVGKQLVLLTLVAFLLTFLFARPYHARDEVNSEIVSTVSILLLITTGINYQVASVPWLSWLGLIIYIVTLIYLFGVLLYPQLERINIWKRISPLYHKFLQEKCSEPDDYSGSSSDNVSSDEDVQSDDPSLPLLIPDESDIDEEGL